MDESTSYSTEEGGKMSMQSKVCVNADGRRQGGSSLQAIVGINIGQVFRL